MNIATPRIRRSSTFSKLLAKREEGLYSIEDLQITPNKNIYYVKILNAGS